MIDFTQKKRIVIKLDPQDRQAEHSPDDQSGTGVV